MNRLLLVGLIMAIFAVLVYIVTAAKNSRKPELVDAIVIFVGTVSLLGAVRLMGFVFTGQFAAVTKATHSENLWSLSSEDSVLVIIGGVALAWVSVQTVIESFAKIKRVDAAAQNQPSLPPTVVADFRTLTDTSDRL
jgi:thiol:disulfide interchange protein